MKFHLVTFALILGVLSKVAAEEDDWWSFTVLEEVDVPQTGSPRVANEIDEFVIARHKAENLSLSKEADRATLIRRVYFDLIGLPPSFEEVEAFISDEDPEAYVNLVEKLLAAPRYGERWARHWLDVVHYGDTHGYDKDKLRPNAHPYRDYIIRAFNEDKRYERFVREQIAGDVLWPESDDAVIATGFIAAGPWDFIGHAEVPETKLDGKVARNLDRDDMVGTTMTSFTSLTVQCARCHDHKSDPVSMEEYYSLQAVFAALDRADRPYGVSPDVVVERRVLSRQIGELDRELAGKPENAADLKELKKELSTKLAELPVPKVVYAGTIHHGSGSFIGTGANGGKPRTIRVLDRGNVGSPGSEVGPGTVNLVPGFQAKFELPESHTEGDRRAALANWIVHPNNPLTWRSIVNRVWLYHFGRGLVNSPNDFGRMGAKPSHPKLLDWLAIRFRDGGQSIKDLHRLILLSSTYRQSVSYRPQAAEVDGGNQFLWRMNRRKLEAEALRDTMLQVAGKLNLNMYGPGFHDFALEKTAHSPHYQYHKHDPEDPATHRRSIYRFLVRSQPSPFMNTLDCADPALSVDQRNETLTVLQALAMLNNKFVMSMSRHFAKRIQQEAPGREIEQAIEFSLSRKANEEEIVELKKYAEVHGLPATCRLIFNLNEFAFVE